MASTTNAWGTRFGLLENIHRTAQDNSVLRELKKRSHEAVSRAAYECGETSDAGSEPLNYDDTSSLFPNRDKVGVFVGCAEREGRPQAGLEEVTKLFPLFRVGSTSHHIGLAAILDERDSLREQVQTWKDTCARHVCNIVQHQEDINWMTERGGCGTYHEWSVDQDVSDNGGCDCVAIRKWDEWRNSVCYRAGRDEDEPANWWELIAMLDRMWGEEISSLTHANLEAAKKHDVLVENAQIAVEEIKVLKEEVETQKTACKNSWAAQEERDESAMAEIRRLSAEKEALKQKVQGMGHLLKKEREKYVKLNHKYEESVKDRVDAAEAVEAHVQKNELLDKAMRQILQLSAAVVEDDE